MDEKEELIKEVSEETKEIEEPKETEETEETEEPVEEQKPEEEQEPEKKDDEEAVALEAELPLEAFVDTSAFQVEKKKKHILRNVLLVLGCIVVLGYFAMVIIFSFCFLPGTTVNGKDISFQGIESSGALLDSVYDGYKLKMVFRDGESLISKNDAGLVVDSRGALQEIKDSQNPFLWFLFFQNEPYTISYEVSYDSESLKTYCSGLTYLDADHMKAPEEPTIAFEGGEVVCQPGDPGTTLDVDKLYEVLDEYLMNLEDELVLDENDCYLTAKYNAESEDIISALEKCNQYVHTGITYQYDTTEYKIEAEDIFNMIRITPSYHCSLDKDLIRSYLEDFSEEHDTLGTDRMFRTHLGDSVMVTGTKYGWQMDVEAETETLYHDILAGNNVKREPEFSQTGYYYKGGNDIGRTYAEVDLTNQHMYLYIDGVQVFDSDFVSGCTNKGRGTPGGLYSVTYKTRDAILRGADYENHVSYWMPFNRGIGFHDASWRSSFGGNIYINNGSHGCINLPPYKARELYDLIEKDMPVVCYWR